MTFTLLQKVSESFYLYLFQRRVITNFHVSVYSQPKLGSESVKVIIHLKNAKWKGKDFVQRGCTSLSSSCVSHGSQEISGELLTSGRPLGRAALELTGVLMFFNPNRKCIKQSNDQYIYQQSQRNAFWFLFLRSSK